MDTKNVWVGLVLSGAMFLFSVSIMLFFRFVSDPSSSIIVILMLIFTAVGSINITRGLMLRNSVKK